MPTRPQGDRLAGVHIVEADATSTPLGVELVVIGAEEFITQVLGARVGASIMLAKHLAVDLWHPVWGEGDRGGGGKEEGGGKGRGEERGGGQQQQGGKEEGGIGEEAAGREG